MKILAKNLKGGEILTEKWKGETVRVNGPPTIIKIGQNKLAYRTYGTTLQNSLTVMIYVQEDSNENVYVDVKTSPETHSKPGKC